jgi:hypothetical protein
MSSVAERLSDTEDIHKASLHFVSFIFRISGSKYKGINNVSVHMAGDSQDAVHPTEQQLCVRSHSKIYPVI